MGAGNNNILVANIANTRDLHFAVAAGSRFRTRTCNGAIDDNMNHWAFVCTADGSGDSNIEVYKNG